RCQGTRSRSTAQRYSVRPLGVSITSTRGASLRSTSSSTASFVDTTASAARSTTPLGELIRRRHGLSPATRVASRSPRYPRSKDREDPAQDQFRTGPFRVLNRRRFSAVSYEFRLCCECRVVGGFELHGTNHARRS